MSRNLFSEQISKPFCQLYVGSWKFHFLTSCCFSQLYVGLLEASLLNFLCLVSNCMLVLVEVCFGTSVDSWKVVRCFPNQVFDQCRWLSFVFEAVEPKKIDKLSLFVLSVIMWTHVIFFIRKFFHLKGGWAGSPFVKREALSHPSFTSFSHPTLGFNNGCSGNNHRQQAPFRLTNEPCCKQWWINFWTLTPGRTQPTQQNLPRLSMQCDRAKRWELRQFLFPSCRFI